MKNFSKKNQSTIDKIPLIGISNLGVLRILRILGGKAKNENGPAQRDSKMSNLVSMDIVTKKGVKEEIFTMRIKNKILFYPLCLCVFVVNTLPRRHSKMSNLKIETENSLPQRHSKMSVLDFVGIASAEHSKQTMFIEWIKKIAGCLMGGRLSVLLCWPHGRETIKLKIESGKLKAWQENIKAKAVPPNAVPESLTWKNGQNGQNGQVRQICNALPLNWTLKCPIGEWDL